MYIIKDQGDFPYRLLMRVINLVMLGASFMIMLYSMGNNPEEMKIIKLDPWIPIIVIAIHAVNLLTTTCFPDLFSNAVFKYIFMAGALFTWSICGYNLAQIYHYWKSGENAIRMIALIYELATITGPVAAYGVTLFLTVIAEIRNKTRYVLEYVPIRV